MDNYPKSESRLEIFLSNPKKALWSLAIPIMFGMGIQTLYNLVDMLFIGRLGGDNIAGVAFNMPIFFLMLGLTMGLGSGVTASIARFIGEENKVAADSSTDVSGTAVAGMADEACEETLPPELCQHYLLVLVP